MATIQDLRQTLSAAVQKKAELTTELAKWQRQREASWDSACYGIKPDYVYQQCLTKVRNSRAEAEANISRIKLAIEAQDKIIKDTTALIEQTAPNDPALIAAKNQLAAIEAGKSKTIYWVIGFVVLVILLFLLYWFVLRKKS